MTRGEFVLFDIGGVSCALPGASVREILPLARLHRPPGAPAMLAGFLNLGGRPIPVIRLARLFGLADGGEAPSVYSHLILAEGAARGTAAFLVDRVTDVRAIEADLRPVADRETLAGSVAGVVEMDGRLVHVLATPRLFLAEERERIAALTAAAEARVAEWATA